MECKFEKYKNFSLIYDACWGDAQCRDIVKLFEDVVETFYADLDISRIPTKNVKIIHADKHEALRETTLKNPRYYYGDMESQIYIHVTGRGWSKYVYQFAHELCHHVIDSPFSRCADWSFGWLEESFCESASLFCLEKMADKWKTNPPYSNWKDYATCLKQYGDDEIKNSKFAISIPFADWMFVNKESLINNRYATIDNFDKNTGMFLYCITARTLLPVLRQNPEHWQSIQYLNDIKTTGKTNIADCFAEWHHVVPDHMKKHVIHIKNMLNF